MGKKDTNKLKEQAKVVCWMLKSDSEQYLCIGNPNPGLSYSISYPFDFNYLKDRYVFCENREVAREVACKANREFSQNKIAIKVKPIRMEITWRSI